MPGEKRRVPEPEPADANITPLKRLGRKRTTPSKGERPKKKGRSNKRGEEPSSKKAAKGEAPSSKKAKTIVSTETKPTQPPELSRREQIIAEIQKLSAEKGISLNELLAHQKKEPLGTATPSGGMASDDEDDEPLSDIEASALMSATLAAEPSVWEIGKEMGDIDRGAHLEVG